MRFLIIDTSQKTSSVIVGKDDKRWDSVIPFDKRPSENLLVVTDQLLKKSKMSVNDIDVYCAVTGPGSFTGIRIGITTIKAFMAVNDQSKLVFANVFEILAKSIKQGYILLPSTNSTFYYGIIKDNAVIKSDTGRYENINEVLIKADKVYTMGCEQLLQQYSYNNYETINDYLEKVYSYFYDAIGNNHFNDNNMLEPFYIQLSQAEAELNKRTKKGS